MAQHCILTDIWEQLGNYLKVNGLRVEEEVGEDYIPLFLRKITIISQEIAQGLARECLCFGFCLMLVLQQKPMQSNSSKGST